MSQQGWSCLWTEPGWANSVSLNPSVLNSFSQPGLKEQSAEKKRAECVRDQSTGSQLWRDGLPHAGSLKEGQGQV